MILKGPYYQAEITSVSDDNSTTSETNFETGLGLETSVASLKAEGGVTKKKGSNKQIYTYSAEIKAKVNCSLREAPTPSEVEYNSLTMGASYANAVNLGVSCTLTIKSSICLAELSSDKKIMIEGAGSVSGVAEKIDAKFQAAKTKTAQTGEEKFDLHIAGVGIPDKPIRKVGSIVELKKGLTEILESFGTNFRLYTFLENTNTKSYNTITGFKGISISQRFLPKLKVKRFPSSSLVRGDILKDNLLLAAGMTASLEMAVKENTNIGPYIIPGWNIKNVEGDGNCFYYSIIEQMRLLHHPFLEGVVEGTLPSDSIRLRVQGAGFRDKEWADAPDILKCAECFDFVIAIVDTRHPDNGFRCYYKTKGDAGDHFYDPESLPIGKTIVKLAFNGNHYLSVEKHPALMKGAIRPASLAPQNPKILTSLSALQGISAFHKLHTLEESNKGESSKVTLAAATPKAAEVTNKPKIIMPTTDSEVTESVNDMPARPASVGIRKRKRKKGSKSANSQVKNISKPIAPGKPTRSPSSAVAARPASPSPIEAYSFFRVLVEAVFCPCRRHRAGKDPDMEEAIPVAEN